MKTFITAAVVTVVFAGAAHAQDPRWAGWIGCWSPAQGTRNIDAARVCVERSGDNGVTLRTTIDGQPVLEQTIIADGTDHPVSDNECRGTQRAEWSADGQRLYARAELMCGNANPRSVSGLALLTADGSWLDVQSVRVDGRDSTRVRRYRRIADGAASAAHFGAALTLDAIKEANGRVPATVLEAAIVETHTTFPLTSREVIDLDEAGVPDRLIDVLIALSYPKKFVVERASSMTVLPPLFDYNDAFYYGYGGYYYSPFAYTYGGYYYPYAFSPAYLTTDNGGGSTRPQASGSGRVIDGVGYTRVSTREATPVNRAPDGSAVAASGSSGGSSSSSSGDSSVSSGGFSSGGSSDGGRTAVPR